MKNITKEASNAFEIGKKFSCGNTQVFIEDNVCKMLLHNNLIAKKDIHNGKTEISNCGYFTNTTKERLNGIKGVSICQKKGVWYLNGTEWNGEFIEI